MVDTFLLAKSFVTLLVITDPVGTVPIFLAITPSGAPASATGPPGRRSSWPP